MLSSWLLCLSIYNKINYKIRILFELILILYTLLFSYLNNDYSFTMICINSFLLVTISMSSLSFKNHKSNEFISAFSIIVFSIVIDIICYFVYPNFVKNQSLISYISSGIIFNFKYFAMNLYLMLILKIYEKIKKSISKYLKNEKKYIKNYF